MNGEKRSDGWVIVNSKWDNRVETKGKLVVTVIFEVKEDVKDKMSVEEYSKYFVENYIKVTGSNRTANMRKGEIIKNNNSELTLKPNEQELKNFTVNEDLEFVPSIPNERQYIVDVFNNSDTTISKVRGNIYLGEDSELLEISPCEIISNHKKDATFELPFWVQIPPNQKLTFYIIVKTLDSDFSPDIIISGVKN